MLPAERSRCMHCQRERLLSKTVVATMLSLVSAKSNLPRVLSTATYSAVGLAIIALGALPLLFLTMLLANGAESDPLVWAATLLVGSFELLGAMLIAYGWGRSRATWHVVIFLGVLWAGLIATYFGWWVLAGITH
ncbi:hypothetical protein [Anatilimnocola floriformis]|uniref:hypothetical protein n=1 Tax=Anatilimnocola floriformis TaxID=2948575 RepID=UPI0020C382F4|nr:hypothetical protein [Anatilimnocola floriformis]